MELVARHSTFLGRVHDSNHTHCRSRNFCSDLRLATKTENQELKMGTRDEMFRTSIEVESAFKWREWATRIPYIKFPGSWEVQVIPPFTGAIARFCVRKPGMRDRVSVYLDCYQMLGCFGPMPAGEPHWEIYPDCEDETARFAMNDTGALVAAIAKSLSVLEAREK